MGFTEAPISFYPTFKFDTPDRTKQLEPSGLLRRGSSISTTSTVLKRIWSNGYPASPTTAPISPAPMLPTPTDSTNTVSDEIVPTSPTKGPSSPRKSKRGSIPNASPTKKKANEPASPRKSKDLGSPQRRSILHNLSVPPPKRTSIGDNLSANSKQSLDNYTPEPIVLTGVGGENTLPYDTSSKVRIPSWTDRILFKTRVQLDDIPDQPPNAAIKIITYDSIMSIHDSDHKPVIGLFSLLHTLENNERRSRSKSMSIANLKISKRGCCAIL
jgi:hypothetical protein